MIVRVAEFIKKRPRLENESRKHDFGEVHSRADLLHQEPNQRLVFLSQLLSLFPGLPKSIK